MLGSSLVTAQRSLWAVWQYQVGLWTHQYPQKARAAAVRQCGTVAKGNCMIYAVDDAVIWKESVAGQQ
jgi:hypothetical protein